MSWVNKNADLNNSLVIDKVNYAFNLEGIEKIVKRYANAQAKECEITNMLQPKEGEYVLGQRIERETKRDVNSDNGIVVLKLFDMMALRLIESASSTNGFTPDLGESICLNTLIQWGVLEKINKS